LSIITKDLNIIPYKIAFDKMLAFTKNRDDKTKDEIWFLQHPAVYTLGQATDRQHIPKNSNIKIVQSNRGGQITYHDLGQLVIYPLLQLNRYNLGVKSLVFLLEQAVIELLASKNIKGERKKNKPGIFIKNKKVASLGLRVSKGCSYHGMAINTKMNLKPFYAINPCGYKGLSVTQTTDEHPKLDMIYNQNYLINWFKQNLSNYKN
jgi:lipoyl(octanoyl) transferase